VLNPGTAIGLAFVTATSTKTSRLPTGYTNVVGGGECTTFQFEDGRTTTFILPAYTDEDGVWKVVPHVKTRLQDLFKWIINDDENAAKFLRLGIVTWLGRDSLIDKVVESMFDPDQFHRLPRMKMCIGA